MFQAYEKTNEIIASEFANVFLLQGISMFLPLLILRIINFLMFSSALVTQKLRVVLSSITAKISVSLLLLGLFSFLPSQCQKPEVPFHCHFTDLTIAAFLSAKIFLNMNQRVNKIQK